MSEFLIWNKKEQDWNFQADKKHYKRDSNFYKCYYCGSNHISFKQNFNEESGKFETKDWRCSECAKTLNFEKFSKLTRDFINNFVLNDLNFLYDNPVKMIVKVKKGTEIDLKILGPKVGIKSDSEHISYKCGKCKNKNQFSTKNDQKNIYQCLSCGFYNILE